MNRAHADPSPCAQDFLARHQNHQQRDNAEPVNPMNHVQQDVIVDEGEQQHGRRCPPTSQRTCLLSNP